MSADILISPIPQTEPDKITAELIVDLNVHWTKTVGDQFGNPVFVATEGEQIHLCTGYIDEITETGFSFIVTSQPKALMPGEIHKQIVYSNENGEQYLLQIRNFGSTALTPSLN